MAKYTKEQRADYMRAQQESGLSIKAYCDREGLNSGTFHYWQKARRAQSLAAPSFIKIAEDQIMDPMADQKITIKYPSGVEVHIAIA